jgi:hypothetical protein
MEDEDGMLYVNMTTATAMDNTIAADDYPPSNTLLDCTDSDDEDCDIMQALNVTQWTDDSLDPSDYITQREGWIATIAANGGPPAYPNNTVVEPDPGDISLQCYSEQPVPAYSGTVDVTTAMAAIKTQCAAWSTQSLVLNSQDYRDTEGFRTANSSETLWLGGFWNSGEPACADGERSLLEPECLFMLSAVINGCDQETTTSKQGGYKVNDCIIWAVAIVD